VIAGNPVTIQLRYLQTLLEIGSEQHSTIVFPLPIDLIGPLTQALDRHRAGIAPAPPREDATAVHATNGSPASS
jgi:hypothetical protein